MIASLLARPLLLFRTAQRAHRLSAGVPVVPVSKPVDPVRDCVARMIGDSDKI